MKPRKNFPVLKCSVALAMSSLVTGHAIAESAAVALENEPLIKELLQRLEERDALVADLQQRVKKLERQAGIEAQDQPAPAAAPPVAARPAPSAAPMTQPSQAKPTPSVEAPAQEEARAEDGQAAQAAPGQFAVDEAAAQRALEQTLITTGNLLLPLGQAEIQPSFTYTRRELDSPIPIFLDGAFDNIASSNIRRNTFDTSLGLILGLPFDSQLELDFPYRYVGEQNVILLNGSQLDERDGHGSGFGDIRVGLAKTLIREGSWWPDVIGRVTWDTATGETFDNDIGLFGGFKELEGSLSLTKRQDPLVFIGSVGYETTFENDDIKPGDALRFSVGAVLAASPETSLRAVLDQTFIDDVKVDGEVINSSDQVSGTLSFGASSVIGRGKFLDINADIGLTDEAPDYAVGISLSILFDVPGWSLLSGD